MLRRVFLATALAAAFVTSASAATVDYRAKLSGRSEVPKVDSKGKGKLDASFDSTSKELKYTLTFEGLSGPATAAHFHAGETGKNGAVVVPITGADKGSFEGSATLTDAQAADMLAGKWYVNVHTAANKAGEIRGQLAK